jgi:hypothetical protein
MVNKRFWLGILVIVLVFGMSVVGCNVLEEDDGAGTINGVWYYVDNNNDKTGSIITVNSKEGTLTAIGEDIHFKGYSNSGGINIGDTVLKNINFQGEWEGLSGKNSNIIYWKCTFFNPYNLQWTETYISYNKEKSYMFIYTSGNPNAGFGHRFKK